MNDGEGGPTRSELRVRGDKRLSVMAKWEFGMRSSPIQEVVGDPENMVD